MKRLIACTMIGSLALLAACGDDDSASDDTTGDTTATGGSGAGGASGFCAVAEELEGLEDIEGDFGDPEALEATMDEQIETVDRAVEEAPDEIAEETRLLADAFKEFADELERVDYNILDIEVAQIVELEENQAFQDASDRLEQYGENECGIPAEDDGEDDGESPFAGMPEGATVRDAMVDNFVEQGIGEQGAQCLADALEPTDFAGGDPSRDRMEELFSECGLDPETGQPVDGTQGT